MHGTLNFKVSHGTYVTLATDPRGNLVLSPTDLMRSECPRDIYEALEDHTCNGLEWLAPENVGALTDGESIWWNSRYAVEDTLAELAAGRSVKWTLGASFTAEEWEAYQVGLEA